MSTHNRSFELFPNRSNYTFLRSPEPSEGRRAEKWLRQFDAFTSTVENISNQLRDKKFLDPRRLEKIKDRLDKIETNARSPQAKAKIHQIKQTLEASEKAAFDSCLESPNSSNLQTKVFIPTPNYLFRGFRNLSLALLHFQGSIFSPATIRAGSPQDQMGAPPNIEHHNTSSKSIATGSLGNHEVIQVLPTKQPVSNDLPGPLHELEPPQSNLNEKTAKKGSWIFFERIHNLRQYFIKKFQSFLNIPEHEARNVHAAIVLSSKEDEIEVLEALYGHPIQKNTYNIHQTFDEQWNIISPPISVVSNSILLNISTDLSELNNRFSDENHYNLNGLVQIPIKHDKFSKSDKIELINALIDFHLLFKCNQDISPNKKYYCSQLVLELTQISVILEKHPEIFKVIEIAISKTDPKKTENRERAKKDIYDRLEQLNIWNQLNEEMIFQFSGASSTPAILMENIRHHSPVIQIKSRKIQDSPEEFASQNQLKALEHLFVLALEDYDRGVKIDSRHLSIRQTFQILSNTANYNKNTQNCLLDQCISPQSNISECVNACLESTLTWEETITLFLTSREINRLALRLVHQSCVMKIHEKAILEIIKNKILISNIYDCLIPTNTGNIITNLENYAVRLYLDSLNAEKIFKNIPLSLAYDPPNSELVIPSLHAVTGYSYESLNCFLNQCRSAQSPTTCVENCLSETLTLKEKLSIYFVSKQLHRILDTLLEDPQFLEFIRHPMQSIPNSSAYNFNVDDPEFLIDQMFPTNKWNPILNIKNYYAREWLKTLNLRKLLKDLPLALAYDPLTPKIAEFLRAERISIEDFAARILHLLTRLQINSFEN